MADEPKATEDRGSAAEGGSAELTAKARVLHVDHVLELVATIVLGAATIATAWSGYQAALWNGVQATDYVQACGNRVESTRASALAGQRAAGRYLRAFVALAFGLINLAQLPIQ